MANKLFQNDYLNTSEQFEKVKDFFEQELKSGNSDCLTELVSEAPNEFKMQIAKELLVIEHQYFLSKFWTYDKNARIRQFPELEEFINELFKRKISSAEFETVRIVKTESSYKINSRAWKQGGQGTIHKGKNLTLGDREVAVKLLKDVSQRPQFEKEAYVTANLDHPGIVAVYSLGSEAEISGQTNASGGTGKECRPFYAMRLVRGETFKERVEKFHKLKFKRRSGAFRDPEFKSLIAKLVSVCNTIEYAHSRGVLHCDIKPSNIKCGPYDATIVLDWGSATSFNAHADYHENASEPLMLDDWTAGSCTLEFASPEQIRQEAEPLSPTSDVYSLGAALYFLLTGLTPHDRARTPASVTRSVSEINDKIPKQLVGICQKATQHKKADRYQSAKELGNDLQNWLRDESVSAAPDGLLEKSFRWTRQHKGLTAALALLVAAITSFVLINGAVRLKQARTLASRDAAFGLIDKIVLRLGRDETSGSKEFRAIAGDLEKFGREYVELGKSDTKLAKAHEILAVVHYFNYNDKSNDFSKDQRAAQLDSAIKEYKAAETILEETDSLELAVIRLKLARMNYRQLGDVADVDTYETVAQARRPLDDAIAYFEAHDVDVSESDVWFEQKLNAAEAQHLSGQYFLLFRTLGDLDLNSSGMNVDSSDSGNPADANLRKVIRVNLTKSREHFSKGVQIREAISEALRKNVEKTADLSADPQLLLRELGRGYGYLGDAEKSLGDYASSLRSYDTSLDFRRQVARMDPDVEYQFQLARGLSNFGMFVRDYGHVSQQADADEFADTFLEEFKTQKRGENFSFSLEEFVLKKYVNEAIEIRERLFNSSRDERFRSDLAIVYNLAAELHYFAYLTEKQLNLDTFDEDERTFIECSLDEHLNSAIEYAEEAANLYPAEEDLTQSQKNSKAVSWMILIQATLACDADIVDQESVADYCRQISELTNAFTEGGAKYEPFLATCVRLKATKREADFNNAIQRLRALSDQEKDYRINRHFPDSEQDDLTAE